MDQDIHLSALRHGARLRNYTIGAILGAGGFGITYKAREDITGREVAIKEYMPTSLAVRDRDRVTVRPLSGGAARDFKMGFERFRHEARLLIEVRHPNIVPVLAYVETNGTGYLVMEFQEGKCLAEILRGAAPLSEGQVLQFIGPLLDAVEEVHRCSFVHRDIKPDNIFIRSDATPLLLDFGAARQALGEGQGSHTAVLTEGYAPFEQYSRKGNQGPWTDIYALGAVMYQCLTGQPPVEAPQRATARLRGLPDPMAQRFADLRRAVSADLACAIETAMSVVEEERPQTVAQLRALIAARTRSAWHAPDVAEPRPSAATLVPDFALASPDRPPPRCAARRERRVRNACFTALAATFLVVSGAPAGLDELANRPLRETGRADARGAAKAMTREVVAACEAHERAALARAQDEAERRIAEEARLAEEARVEERKSVILAEYQRQQLELLEAERQQQLLSARRLAEAERKKGAEAKEPAAPAAPAEPRPPTHEGRLGPFRIIRVW